uniref:serine O-acetyltransferase EpsC n=1 Tax=Castellaniella defragrans TaxID=75697 RepID=UPI003342C77E
MASFNVTGVVQALDGIRTEWRDSQKRAREPDTREFPSRTALAEVVEALKGVLFPMRLGPVDLRHASENFYVGHTLDTALHRLLGQACLELRYASRHDPQDEDSLQALAFERIDRFAQALPDIRRRLDQDVLAAYSGDPAATSVDEVLLCYPGVLALIHHRLAHQLYALGLPLLARIIAELAHSQTGIDIHPGARIGDSFFIDHGTGVVIGETAVIGNRVRIYQAVTLGAKRFATDEEGHLEKGGLRHPIVEDDVVIYAGATILGRVTLGKGAVIGGNVWITSSVPPGGNITQANLRHALCTDSQQA